MFAASKRVDRVCLAVSGALFAFFLVASVASAQCNPGRVFDERNLSLGNALSQGTLACQDGRCNLPAPPPQSGALSAEASAIAQIQKLQATVAALESALQGNPAAIATAGGGKQLRMAQHGSSAAAAASAIAGYEEPTSAPPVQAPTSGTLGYVPVQMIPVALASNTSSASSASSVAGGGGGCDGGRFGFFRRASRTRTRTSSTVNGQRSTSSSSSVSR